MKNFIFLTHEGFAKTPKNKDIENLQVIGTANGQNEKQAFDNLVKENKFLLNADYDEIIGLELRNEKFYYFSLKEL